MTVSDITVAEVCQQARISDAELDEVGVEYIENLLAAAKSYVKSYTGLSDLEMDNFEELSIAVLALAADMYDNREVAAEKSNVNRVVDTILGMHCRNLL